MKLAVRAMLCLPILAFAVFAPAQGDGPTVELTGGQVRGRSLPTAGAVFRRVPYAQAPLGDLRWREAMPVKAWAGVREAAEPGAPCAQAALGWNDQYAAVSKEDCLYLDVWTPEWPAKSPKPVMVWIHGGGNVAGAGGSDPLYDGKALIRHGVVLVIIEYRLGVLGFFSHPELTRESPYHASGNYGILDQLAALQWVHDNIAKLGGDPGNVTVFGQSAGSLDTLLLMTTSLSRDLFHRALGESGALYHDSLTLAEAERKGSLAAEMSNAPASGELKYLRSLPVQELLKSGGYQGIVVDGHVFTASPVKLFASRRRRMPLILGSNAIEMAAPGPLDTLRKAVTERYKSNPGQALMLYGLAGPDRAGTNDPVFGNLADQFGSDALHCEVAMQGAWHSAGGDPTWEYQFDRAIPPRPKTGHSSELPYVFGNLYGEGSQAGTFTDADRKLSATMQAYWTNFAKTGDPNGEGLPDWPRFDGKSRKYAEFTADAGVTVNRNQRGEFCDLLGEAGKP